MTTATAATLISPSIHESAITRHMKDDTDNVLNALHDGVKLAREMCTKAASTTEAVMANRLETEAQRHRKAREAGFALLERATKSLDAAMTAAQSEIKTINERVSGPPQSKDVIVEQRQRELRERLAQLPKERQTAILFEAVANGDDNLVAAVLHVPNWMLALSKPELDLVRLRWAQRKYPQDLDRLERIEKAVTDAQRAGQLSIAFVDSLTDAAMIAEAEKGAKKSADALAAAKA